MIPFLPWCTNCGGTGTITTKIQPRIESGRLVTHWCVPCGCGGIQNFGKYLVRMANHTDGNKDQETR